jgi:hypothetical protein
MGDKTNEIERMLGQFDFHKVARVMEFLNWTWVDTYPDTSTVVDLVERARDLLHQISVSSRFTTYIGTGGLVARQEPDEYGILRLSLEFVLESVE